MGDGDFMGGIWRSASSAVDLEMDIVVAAGNLDGTNDDGGDGDGDGDDDDVDDDAEEE